ncbi:hypothetical protein [Rhizobium leguminosarum]|uniref:hypothetical protein n=1 Tax=Rhizobium leguminosarum TaxID=384 RepID=UPI0010313495|nr:hypothetical protein [Rhizobium leguminosarum]TBG30047.1 hypothetical protein ELG75_37360 [Rhizobium leguminosarum]TBG71502.1 hypothetical protein ELG76_37120 [Rhizobium leguminosarum]
MAEPLARQLVCNLYQTVLVPVAIAGCIPILAVSKAIVEDANRAAGKIANDSICKDRLADTTSRMDYDRTIGSNYVGDQFKLLIPR